MPELPIGDTITREQAIAAPFLPGMQPGEQVLAQAWLREHGSAYQRFGFNVRIGQGADVDPSYPESARRFVKLTTQKRIDIVAFTETAVSLLEVKIQANLGAVGQLLGYVHLWTAQYPAWPVEATGVICHLISADTLMVYANQHIPVFLMADVDLPPLLTPPRSE